MNIDYFFDIINKNQWWLFPKAERHTVRESVQPTPSTKSLNIKRVKKAKPLREEEGTTENNQAMEDKPNPSSETNQKLPRRSPSDCNVTNAKEEESSWSAEPNLSFSWISRKSKRKTPEEETPCTNDLPVHI